MTCLMTAGACPLPPTLPPALQLRECFEEAGVEVEVKGLLEVRGGGDRTMLAPFMQA